MTNLSIRQSITQSIEKLRISLEWKLIFHVGSTPRLWLMIRMVKVIADEFLTDERERKYYADRYSCCPPPLFIIFITLVEVSFSLNNSTSHSTRIRVSIPALNRYRMSKLTDRMARDRVLLSCRNQSTSFDGSGSCFTSCLLSRICLTVPTPGGRKPRVHRLPLAPCWSLRVLTGNTPNYFLMRRFFKKSSISSWRQTSPWIANSNH